MLILLLGEALHVRRYLPNFLLELLNQTEIKLEVLFRLEILEEQYKLHSMCINY